MAAIITLTCPKCKLQICAPIEARGKRIRCKGCGAVFALVEKAKANPAAAPSKAAAAPAQPPAVVHQPHADFDDDQKPYDVTELDLASRCPHCAAEMAEDDILCLGCGYNTQTRLKTTTLRVVETTSNETFRWLAPGFVCAFMLLPLTAALLYLWLAYANVSGPVLPLDYSDSVTIGIEKQADKRDGWLWMRIYGSVIATTGIYFCAWFAYNRLYKNREPPLKIKAI